MERPRPLELEVGRTLTTIDGIEISALFQPEDPTPTDETDDHEAAHAIVAGRVREVSRRPTSTSLGHTIPEVMTAEAAMAAEALGFGGTGHDRMVAYALGADPESAKSSSRATLSTRRLEMRLVAQSLHKHGTIGQAEVDEAFSEAERIRRGIRLTKVSVKRPDGTHVFETESLAGGKVMVPHKWYALPVRA